MPQTYCIYSDREVPEEQTSLEHVIPLALGGCDSFTIKVSRSENSRLGSAVDGALANDPLIALIRSKRAVAGQSAAPEAAIWKKCFLGGDHSRPVQMRFPSDITQPLEIWDAKQRRTLRQEELAATDGKFSARLKIERFSRLRLAAKIALGGGYFVYGDTFRTHADHAAIRHVMNINPSAPAADLSALDVQVCDPFTPISERDLGFTGIFRHFATQLDSSVCFLVCQENIIASVSVVGQWLGTVNFKASTQHFPASIGNHRLGSVLSIKDRQLSQKSFWDMTAILAGQLHIHLPDQKSTPQAKS